jgi:hypothetical protein
LHPFFLHQRLGSDFNIKFTLPTLVEDQSYLSIQQGAEESSTRVSEPSLLRNEVQYFRESDIDNKTRKQERERERTRIEKTQRKRKRKELT